MATTRRLKSDSCLEKTPRQNRSTSSGSFSSQLRATPSCKNGLWNAFLTALAPFLLNSHEEPRPSATCRESLPGRTAVMYVRVSSKYWLGQLHQGIHKPVISRDLYDRVQAMFAAANHPRHTKRRHALAGLVTCGRCGCAFTAEIKKGQYVYYHCTGHGGPCGNTYVREEELIRQLGELLKQVRIPTELAGKLATVLRESQTDKEKFVRTSMLRLEQQQMLLRSKLDRVYEDRLSDAIPEELWHSKSAALQDELRQVRTEMERHEVASQACETAGLQILELAQTAYSSYVAKNPHEQARLIKTLVSNSTFDRGSLSPTYVKPFDVFAKGSETWRLAPRAGLEPATLRLTGGKSAVSRALPPCAGHC
jgi:Recombinase zinc beta ribbon domain